MKIAEQFVEEILKMYYPQDYYKVYDNSKLIQ